jgi:hypothetical protein
MFREGAGVNENRWFLVCNQHFSNLRQYSVPGTQYQQSPKSKSKRHSLRWQLEARAQH